MIDSENMADHRQLPTVLTHRKIEWEPMID